MSKKEQPRPAWRSVADQAARLGLTPTIIKAAIHAKELRAYGFGGSRGWMVKDADADEWLKGKASK